MSQEIDPKIHDAVSRFLKSRREGVRLSVEQALGGRASAADAVSAARLIAQSAKSQGAPSVIGGAPGDDGASAPGHPEPIELPEIEGYDIIDIVGRGGMGAVYEAYQRSTGRRVAVKMMLETLGAGERTRRRFEREVELVARLQHPNIVSVLDSGVQRGRYFYVMEYIEGRTLDAVYPPGAAEPRAVLEILARIALAVDYAHQRGVIHRDLKPGNILIDERCEPHLLDFGLAKSFDPNSLVGVRASLSEPGQFLGTLLYMPPEQARGETESMSVRSDVYSLGAIGYELITGRPPCGTDGPLGLVLERINSIDPARPSTIRAEVGRDCDAILMKCLEKVPIRRYGSAGDLAADIRRSLNNEPIVARRTSAPVRAWRWVKRHKLATTVAAAVVAIGVTSGGLWTLHVIRTEQQKAENERQKREASEKFSRDVSTLQKARAYDYGRGRGIVDPEISKSRLDELSHEAGERYPDSPADEASVRMAIGAEYRRWAGNSFPSAEREFKRARELFARGGPARDLDLAEADFEIGSVLYFLGDYQSSERSLSAAAEFWERKFGRLDEKTQLALLFLASPLQSQGQFARAEILQREVLKNWRQLSTGDNLWQLGMPLNNLAHSMLETGQFAEAELLLREALSLAERDPKDPVIYRSRVLTNLGIAVCRSGRAAESLEMLDEALKAKRDQYKQDNDDTARTIFARADALIELGRADEAFAACDEALRIRTRSLGEQHPSTAMSLLQRGTFLATLSRCEEAEPLLRRALAIQSERFKPPHHLLADIETVLGDCLRQSGRFEEAESMLRSAAGTLMNTRTARHPSTQRAVRTLAAMLRQSNRDAEAGDWERQVRSTAAPSSR